MKKSNTELAYILGSGHCGEYVLEAMAGLSKDQLTRVEFAELIRVSVRQIFEVYELIDFRGFRGFVADGTIERGFGYKVCLRKDGAWVLIYSDRDGNNELGVYANKSEARMAFVALVYEGEKFFFEEIRNKRLRELI